MPPARRRYRPWLPAPRVCRASRSWDWCPFSGSVIAGRSARVQWLGSLAAWVLTSRLSASDTTLTNHGADQQRAAFPLRKRRAPSGARRLPVAAARVGGAVGWGEGGGWTLSRVGGPTPAGGGFGAGLGRWRNQTGGWGAEPGNSPPPLNDALFSAGT